MLPGRVEILWSITWGMFRWLKALPSCAAGGIEGVANVCRQVGELRYSPGIEVICRRVAETTHR
jgi:hypothetical protein